MRTANRTLLVIWLLVTPVVAPADGTVEEHVYYSPALGMDRVALVYLPEGYAISGLSYPVVYFIPGFGGRAGSWYSVPELVEVLDTMIGDGLVDPFILVEVDRSCLPWAPDLPAPVPSYLVDSELNGDHETALVRDLIPWIDRSFRTIAERANRFILGRSAGGYGAARVALRHPEVFGGLATQVGVVALEPIKDLIPMLLAEYPEGPPYDFSPAAGVFSYGVFAWATAFSPNLTKPPWYVDLFVDRDGNLDPEVWDRWASQSPTRWAAELAAAGGELDIFMDCGGQDFYQPFTTAFATALDTVGLPYTMEIFAGDHGTPPMWQRLQTHITYFLPLEATVEIIPDPFRHWTGGVWVIAWLELPGDLAVTDIDLETLAITRVNGDDLAMPIMRTGPTHITDVNGNGTPDLMIRFYRHEVDAQLREHPEGTTGAITIAIRGKLQNGWFLEAIDDRSLEFPGLSRDDGN